MTLNLSWDTNPTRKTWSNELISAVRSHMTELEQGNPDSFVSGYNGLLDDNKVRYWAELVIRMIKWESSFNPHCIFHEPAPLNVDSVGLLQLSYGDGPNYHLEPLSLEHKSLEDPLLNIRCGLKILAHWLAKDKVVAEGTGHDSKGGARYWSVLRTGASHHREDIRTHVKSTLGL